MENGCLGGAATPKAAPHSTFNAPSYDVHFAASTAAIAIAIVAVLVLRKH